GRGDALPARGRFGERHGERLDALRRRLRVRARRRDRHLDRQAARARPGRPRGPHVAEVDRARAGRAAWRLIRATPSFSSPGGLPNTFVPVRNLLFFTVAASVADRRGLSVLIGGMCETDYSGYPDCRDNTLKSLQVAISLGLDKSMTIETPLMWLDKAATWAMTEALGGETLIELVIEHTHSCYLGDREHRHAWGWACG